MSSGYYQRVGGRFGSGDGGLRSCYTCGELGHLSRDCNRRRGGRKHVYGRGGAGGRSCFVCGEPGHLARDCHQRPGWKEGGGRGSGGGGVRSCFNCGELGHLARDCHLSSNPTLLQAYCHFCAEWGHIARDCNVRIRMKCSDACTLGTGNICYLDGRPVRIFGDCCRRAREKNGNGGSCSSSSNGVETGDSASSNLNGPPDALEIPPSSSNEGDKDETLSSEGLISIEIQPSFSNEGDKSEILSSGPPVAIEIPPSSSNEVDKDESHENLSIGGLIAIKFSPSSFNECSKDETSSRGAPIVIEISSSSSSEDEEEEHHDVRKNIGFLNVRVKKEEKSQEDGDDDCCILDFDPFQPPAIQFKHKLSLSNEPPSTIQDDDISIIAERGQVACRDYPHPRHLCGNYPFSDSYDSSHESFCPQCYCYVCDKVAPCFYWEGSLGHCHASDREERWRLLRSLLMNRGTRLWE